MHLMHQLLCIGDVEGTLNAEYKYINDWRWTYKEQRSHQSSIIRSNTQDNITNNAIAILRTMYISRSSS